MKSKERLTEPQREGFPSDKIGDYEYRDAVKRFRALLKVLPNALILTN